MIEFLKENEFDELVLGNDRLVIVQFCTHWNASCYLQEGVLLNIKKEYQDKIKLYRVDIDENQKLCKKLGIIQTHQLLFFYKKKRKVSLTGLISYSELIKILKSII